MASRGRYSRRVFARARVGVGLERTLAAVLRRRDSLVASAAAATASESHWFRLRPSAAAASAAARCSSAPGAGSTCRRKVARDPPAAARRPSGNGPPLAHGSLEGLDAVPLEVDFVAQIDALPGKRAKLRVELDGPRVSLVLDHDAVSAPTCFRTAQVVERAPNAPHEPGAAFFARVRAIDGEIAAVANGSDRSAIAFECAARRSSMKGMQRASIRRGLIMGLVELLVLLAAVSGSAWIVGTVAWLWHRTRLLEESTSANSASPTGGGTWPWRRGASRGTSVPATRTCSWRRMARCGTTPGRDSTVSCTTWSRSTRWQRLSEEVFHEPFG
jgi:hypothetical protein